MNYSTDDKFLITESGHLYIRDVRCAIDLININLSDGERNHFIYLYYRFYIIDSISQWLQMENHLEKTLRVKCHCLFTKLNRFYFCNTALTFLNFLDAYMIELFKKILSGSICFHIFINEYTCLLDYLLLIILITYITQNPKCYPYFSDYQTLYWSVYLCV